MKLLNTFALLLLTGLFCHAQAGTISTIPQWNGSEFGDWGSTQSGAAPTYGQTFQATATNFSLNSMLFEIDAGNHTAIDYQAYVYAWNNAIVGPALFTSAVETVPAASAFQAITVSTGAVTLVPGQEYIALFSTIGDANSPAAVATWGTLGTTQPYAAGQWEYSRSTDFSGLSTAANWNPDAGLNNMDLAFTLQFGTTAAPEPSSLLTLAGGLAAFSLLALKRKHARRHPTQI